MLREVMGPAFDDLPRAVRQVHVGNATLRGQIEVLASPNPVWRILARFGGLPRATRGLVAFRFQTPEAAGHTTWHRDIEDQRMSSTCWAENALLVEKVGPLTVSSQATFEDGVLGLAPQSIRVLGLPLPRLLWPGIKTAEWQDGSLYHFDILLTAPLFGAVLAQYRGWLDPR